jgi:uncharacterized protein YggE
MDRKQRVISVLAICLAIIFAGSIMMHPSGILPVHGQTLLTSSPSNGTNSNPRTLSLSGTATVYAQPDQVVFNIGAYTEERTASAAIDENAVIMTAVLNAIKGQGVKAEKISTSYYTVTPNYSYDAKMVISYQVTNMMQVKISDLSKVGAIIDAASAAGANKVDSISFGLSDVAANKIKLSAYTAAIADVKAKASVITQNLGIAVTGVQSVNENFYYPQIDYLKAAVPASGASASTPILQGNISVTVTLNIVYLIGPA